MPAAYSPQQRATIQQFVSFTTVKESVAAKHLKAAGWNLEQAVNAYFQQHGSVNKDLTNGLNKLFDKYREDPKSPDSVGVEGAMKYLQDLSVSLEETVMLAVFTQLEAPTMGELTRAGFVNGWERRSIPATRGLEKLDKQKEAIVEMRQQLKNDADFFKAVYKHTFFLARSTGQKAVMLDAAVEFWRMLFGEGGLRWKDSNTDWLELYINHLETNWKKSISRDLWDQTLVFAGKTLDDGTLSWWSEESAWPGILDEFVEFVRKERGDATGNDMDTS